MASKVAQVRLESCILRGPDGPPLAHSSDQVGCILPESPANSEASCTKAKLEQKWFFYPPRPVFRLWERIQRLFPSPVTQSSHQGRRVKLHTQ